jgi:hypothetical protein
MKKLLVTPKNKASLIFLRKLFTDLKSINKVEVVDDSEVTDHTLIAKMKRNLKTGLTTHHRVLNTLDKIILKAK